MKAVVCKAYNDFQQLVVEDIPKPRLQEREVLIRIRASTVSRGDSVVRTADRLLMRLIFGLKRPRKSVLGTELAGTVEAVGAKVSQFRAGDRVVASPGLSFGGHAEYIALKENGALTKIPDELSFTEAVALLFGGTAALHYLKKVTDKPGRDLLVYGASGAVGTAGVQLAKHFGFKVTAVCSSNNQQAVKDLGADQVLDYTQPDWQQALTYYDAVFDTVGKTQRKAWKPYLKDHGSFLTTARGLVRSDAASLELLLQLASQNQLKPVIDSCFPITEIAAAYQRVESGHKLGNVILVFE